MLISVLIPCFNEAPALGRVVTAVLAGLPQERVRAVSLREERCGFEPEVPARLAQCGARFLEVGVSCHGRAYEEGKKVGLSDAFRACWEILKSNLLSGT